MKKYQGKYRIETSRKRNHDYARPGKYFITLNSYKRLPIFGTIVNGRMNLSPIGEIVDKEWRKSFEIRSELRNMRYVIMPDHLHAIVNIKYRIIRNDATMTGTPGLHRASRSLSSFVAGFKSSATIKINELRQTPRQKVWQPRYHDRIIRNLLEYRRISRYIINNPRRWRL